MLKLLFCIVITLATVRASGEFVVLHSPDSVVFTGNEEVEQSLLKEVLAAALGFTPKMRGMWSGMSITDPFRLPEAVVAMTIEGVDSVEIPKAEKFPLYVDEAEETTWQAVSGRLEERDNDNTLVRISLSDGLEALGHSSLGELKPTPIDESSLKSLSLNKEEDKNFIDEMQLLKAIAEKVPTAINTDSKPDVYWLVLSGLRPIFDAHGKNSSAAREALTLLRNTLHDVSEAFIEAYDGKVIVAAFTNDASQVRHARSAVLERQLREAQNEQDDGQDENKNVGDEEDTNINIDSTSESSDMSTSTTYSDFRDENSEGTEKSDQDLTSTENNINSNTQRIGQGEPNLSEDYSEDYPVIFNIFLWFGIIFAFSLLAICIAIADMDPGRDSIIYRMTSNRMKKDN